jgi:hypothetical protein
LKGKWARPARRRAVWVPTQAQHDATASPSCGKVSRNFDERLTGAEALYTVWVKGLYRLTVLDFPSYLVKTISSYLQCRTLQVTFHSATSTCRDMRAGVAQGGTVSPVLISL